MAEACDSLSACVLCSLMGALCRVQTHSSSQLIFPSTVCAYCRTVSLIEICFYLSLLGAEYRACQIQFQTMCY